jgi:hypothetical protein
MNYSSQKTNDMNEKTIIPILAIGLFWMASCTKDNNPLTNPSLSQAAKSQLPANSINLIEDSYPGAVIDQSFNYREDGRHYFRIDLNWNYRLYFDNQGNLLAVVDDDSQDDLYQPLTNVNPAILDFINSNFPGAALREVEHNMHPDGSMTIEVELSNGREIYFDANGNYICQDDNPMSSSSSNGNHVSPGTLPQAIQDYLAANYSGITVLDAEQYRDAAGNIWKYEVELADGTKLHFDANGSLMVDDNSSSGQDDSIDISLQDLPAVVRDYLQQNFSSETVEKAKKRIDLQGNVKEYEVRFESDIRVFFDAQGNHLRTVS